MDIERAKDIRDANQRWGDIARERKALEDAEYHISAAIDALMTARVRDVYLERVAWDNKERLNRARKAEEKAKAEFFGLGDEDEV